MRLNQNPTETNIRLHLSSLGRFIRVEKLFKWVVAFSLCGADTCVGLAQEKTSRYQNNFEKSELDKSPEGFVILDGSFAVKEAEGNRFLELPGAPLDTFGALFGPKEKEGVQASVRVYGTAKGRRFPVFALGLAGISGYKLQVSPAKRAIELYRGDALKTAVPYQWNSGQWTHLRLQIRKTNTGWKADGKVWAEGQDEPGQWMISAEGSEALAPGQASLFGSPFSGTAIRFDDVVVSRIVEPPPSPTPDRKER